MNFEEIKRKCSMPLLSPGVPDCGHMFNRREHLFITYKTDRDALRRVVPEPLELLDEPLVRFEIMYMPDATGYGSYTESGQAIPVEFRGEEGEYLHMMYLDNFEATARGREVGAYPKKWGFPKLFVDGDTLVGTLDYGPSHMRVATATMTYKFYEMDFEEARAEICTPNFMLKAQAGYDSEPRILELLRTVPEKCEILEAWSGYARLQLFEHVNAPLADLPVREIVKANYIITNTILGKNTMIYNYLEEEQA